MPRPSVGKLFQALVRGPQPNLTLEEALTQIGPGWHPIIQDLWPKLEGAQVVQVKEKFGGLCVYLLKDGKREGCQKDLFHRLREAEAESFRTCDVCGEPGSLIGGPREWKRTRCQDHGDADMPDHTGDPKFQRAWISVLVQGRQHLLIGTSAVTRYLPTVLGETELDFLATDLFSSGIPTFLDLWAVEHHRSADAISVPSWGMDFVRAEASPTLKRVFDREATFGRYATASLEALAATKFLAAVSPSRSRDKKIRDVEELAGLVRLKQFSRRRSLVFLAGEVQETRELAERTFDAIKKGKAVEL